MHSHSSFPARVRIHIATGNGDALKCAHYMYDCIYKGMMRIDFLLANIRWIFRCCSRPNGKQTDAQRKWTWAATNKPEKNANYFIWCSIFFYFPAAFIHRSHIYSVNLKSLFHRIIIYGVNRSFSASSFVWCLECQNIINDLFQLKPLICWLRRPFFFFFFVIVVRVKLARAIKFRSIKNFLIGTDCILHCIYTKRSKKWHTKNHLSLCRRKFVPKNVKPFLSVSRVSFQ